jgi:hypothetical protein
MANVIRAEFCGISGKFGIALARKRKGRYKKLYRIVFSIDGLSHEFEEGQIILVSKVEKEPIADENGQIGWLANSVTPVGNP